MILFAKAETNRTTTKITALGAFHWWSVKTNQILHRTGKGWCKDFRFISNHLQNEQSQKDQPPSTIPAPFPATHSTLCKSALRKSTGAGYTMVQDLQPGLLGLSVQFKQTSQNFGHTFVLRAFAYIKKTNTITFSLLVKNVPFFK